MFLFILVIILALVLCGTRYSVMLSFVAIIMLVTGYVDFDNCVAGFEDKQDYNLTSTADTDASKATELKKDYEPTNVAAIVAATLDYGGDEEIYERMQHVARGAETSQMLNARRNVRMFDNLYRDELDATEARVWWEVDVADSVF